MSRLRLFIIATLSGLVILSISNVNAFNPLEVPCGVTGAEETAVCEENQKEIASDENPIAVLIGNIAMLVAFFVGIVSVFVIMYGGFSYITSGGDSGKTAKAKSLIIWAIIGLAVSALSFVITIFLVDNFVAG